MTAPDCSFVLSVEQGKLESQALLLVESLRMFGGQYSRCPVYAISPRPSRQMGAACRDALKAMGAEVVMADLLSPDETYGPIARLAACVWAENNATSEILVSLDNDMFFAAGPDFSLDGADIYARPVDVKGICTSGPDDVFDRYWRDATRHCGIDYRQIPWIATTVDRVTVKASYNGGMVAVRRQAGLFRAAQEVFATLRRHGLAPRPPGSMRIRASTGLVDPEPSRWWGSSQVALSLAAVRLQASVRMAPRAYNVPVHLLELSRRTGAGLTLKDAVLVHYHWLLDAESATETFALPGEQDLPAPVLAWLRTRTPLRPRE